MRLIEMYEKKEGRKGKKRKKERKRLRYVRKCAVQHVSSMGGNFNKNLTYKRGVYLTCCVFDFYFHKAPYYLVVKASNQSAQEHELVSHKVCS